MSFLAQYTPHLITGVAIFSAILCHWAWPKRFWKPSLFCAAIASITAYLLFAFVPRQVDGNLLHEFPNLSEAIGFAFVSSFVVAVLIGYLMKFAPSLFKD